MSQIARPSADITVGSYTTAPLFSKLNETTPNDATYILSPGSPASAMCEVRLDSLTDPGVDNNHIISYRIRNNALGLLDEEEVQVRLMQGATLIAAGSSVPVTDSFVTHTLSLSGAQIASITDYTDLRLRIYSNELTTDSGNAVRISYVDFTIPDVASGIIAKKKVLFQYTLSPEFMQCLGLMFTTLFMYRLPLALKNSLQKITQWLTQTKLNFLNRLEQSYNSKVTKGFLICSATQESNRCH